MTETVRDNPAKSRFELDTEGHTAVALYRRAGNLVSIYHTEVAPEVSGRGIGSRLVRGALELARSQGLKVEPRCSFVRSYVAQHPEFSDVLK